MKSVAQVELDTINKVMAILGEMPYNKVFELIAEMQRNTKIVQLPDEEEKAE